MTHGHLHLSLVIPVRNEVASIPALAQEITNAFSTSSLQWEAVWIDDGSDDGTATCLKNLPAPHRFISFTKNCGKSAAYQAGFAAAHGAWIATLDGDGQDDPVDVARLLAHAEQHVCDLVIGIRNRRSDSFLRRVSSFIGNRFRRLFTGDRFIDIGCGVRVGRHVVFQGLPFFEGMHRFLPTLIAMHGHKIDQLSVSNRNRSGGSSKYGLFNRCFVGLMDVIGVRWLLKRQRKWVIADKSPDIVTDNNNKISEM